MANYGLEGSQSICCSPSAVCIVDVILHSLLFIVQETLSVHVFSQLDSKMPEEKAELDALFVEIIVDASMAFSMLNSVRFQGKLVFFFH